MQMHPTPPPRHVQDEAQQKATVATSMANGGQTPLSLYPHDGDVTRLGSLSIKWMASPAVAPHKRYALNCSRDDNALMFIDVLNRYND
jgi:hypothetical protein